MSQLAKESHPGQDQEFVKGLGLTSATTLVMGSMIGSGVFIVAADIARIVDSPALLIAAWLVTGFMTVVAALSYGELAAMMPKAGGQYVYLREALGPFVGLPLRLDALPGNSVRHHCRRRRGLRQVSRSIPSFGFLLELDRAHLEGSADSSRTHGAGQHGCGLEHPEPGCHRHHRAALHRQHLRRQDRSHRAGGVYHRQSRGAAGTHPARHLGWQHAGGAAAPISAPTSGSMRGWARCTKFPSESAERPRWSPPSPSLPWRRSVRCFPPMPGTTSPSPPARFATRNATCRSRSPSEPAPSSSSTLP